MNIAVHHAASVRLRDRAAALLEADAHAVIGIYRRPSKVYLRDLVAISEALAAHGGPIDAFPEAARRIRERQLYEFSAGLTGLAFIGTAHDDIEGRARIGSAVFTDGKVAYLTAPSEGEPVRWQLFEDGTEAVDRWVIGLSMVLAALTGKPGPWGGAA